MKKHRIIFIVGVIISAVCTWLFARKIEWHNLGEAFWEAKYIYLLPATVVVLFSYVIRAIRWKILMQPVKKVSFKSLFSATSIGFMTNCILPARVGEIIKPVFIGKKEKIKVSASLATVLMERVFDFVSLIIFAIVVLAVIPAPSTVTQGELSNPHATTTVEAHGADVSNPHENSTANSILKLKKFAFILIIPLAAILIVAFVLAKFPLQVKGWLGKHLTMLPERISHKLVSFVEHFISGFEVLTNGAEVVQLSLLSAIIWGLMVLEAYCISFSFGMGLPFLGACLVTIFVSFAVALPQAPGFIGVFHIATLTSLELCGIELASSQSYAIILWAIGVFPITIMGLYFLWHEGLALRSISKLEEEGED